MPVAAGSPGPFDRKSPSGSSASTSSAVAVAGSTVTSQPALARQLQDLALRAWDLFSLAGYARVDFRVDDSGAPTILEINANPCLEPQAGFAAAARQAGYGYDDVIATIARVAAHG